MIKLLARPHNDQGQDNDDDLGLFSFDDAFMAQLSIFFFIIVIIDDQGKRISKLNFY